MHCLGKSWQGTAHRHVGPRVDMATGLCATGLCNRPLAKVIALAKNTERERGECARLRTLGRSRRAHVQRTDVDVTRV